jgi:uncharacterized protein (UPF0261 family)
LKPAKGPVKVFLPRRGVSLYAKEGGAFFDPEADERCRKAVREGLAGRFPVEELDVDINDPTFARACAQGLLDLLRGAGARARAG